MSSNVKNISQRIVQPDACLASNFTLVIITYYYHSYFYYHNAIVLISVLMLICLYD